MNHQSSPYAGTGPLDDLPGLLGHGGHPGERDGRHRDREQQGVARVVREVADQRAPSRRRCAGTPRRDVAALAVGARAGVQRGVRSRASTSTGAQSSWPSSASAAWPRAKVGSRATALATRHGPHWPEEPEQVRGGDAAVVGGDRLSLHR